MGLFTGSRMATHPRQPFFGLGINCVFLMSFLGGNRSFQPIAWEIRGREMGRQHWAVIISIGALAAPVTITHAHDQNVSAAAVIRMSEERFWSIVDQSIHDDLSRQIEALRSELVKLSPEEIEGFEATFDKQMRRSYRWDLWGALYVAMGGASDDSFEYFRLWLISRGRDAFSKVVADPDSLADIAPDDPLALEFEELAHLAPDVWSAKTGKSWEEMPYLASFFNPLGYGTPAGEPFPEDPEELSRQYPKLSNHFKSGPSFP